MEPLLQRIKEDRTAVLTPIIDVIDDKTLQYFNSNGDFFQVRLEVTTVHSRQNAAMFQRRQFDRYRALYRENAQPG